MRVGNVSCDVIGVLDGQGPVGIGTDQDNTVMMPLRAFQRRIAGNTRYRDHLYRGCLARAASTPYKLPAETEQLLRERRRVVPGEEDDFSVRDMTQIISAMTSTTSC